jgi:hypothetical protein
MATETDKTRCIYSNVPNKAVPKQQCLNVLGAAGIVIICSLLGTGCANHSRLPGEEFDGHIRPLPVVRVEPVSSNVKWDTDFTPNPVGLIANVVNAISATKQAMSDEWRVIYMAPQMDSVILKAIGAPKCMYKALITPYTEDVAELGVGDYIRVEKLSPGNRRIVRVMDADNQPQKISSDDPCYQMFVDHKLISQ